MSLPKKLKSKLPKKQEQKQEQENPPGENCDYLLLGEEAVYGVINRSMDRAAKYAEHERPDLPDGFNEYDDITSLSGPAVGRMLQYFTGQHAYLLVELAKADQMLVAAETVHGTLKRQKSILLDSGQTKYRLDAEISSDPKIQKAYTKVLEASAFKDMLSALCKGTELKRDLCSREITRRASEK